MPRVVIVSASERRLPFRPGQRLHRPEEFSAVMAARRVFRGESFDLHYRQADGGMARLGWIVPKRLARAASLRNAIKRQGREAFRLMAADIRACDLVLRLKQPQVGVRATDKSRLELWRAEIEALLKRLQAQPS